MTLEVVPEIDPVTTSLNLYVPIPVSNGGGAIVIPGALKYPTPASMIRISVILPEVPTTARPTAVIAKPAVGAGVIETVGIPT